MIRKAKNKDIRIVSEKASILFNEANKIICFTKKI